MIKRSDVDTSLRLAGQVKRYHTWPVLHEQTVAEHTWQAMRLYWELYGEFSPGVSAYLLFHDAAEIGVGDLPFPVKAHNPPLKAVFDDLEDQHFARMVGPDRAAEVLSSVTELERIRMKLCDLLEMHEYGLHERMLGNAFATPIVLDTRQAILTLLEQVPESERSVVARRVLL